jgi:hypothetical protein
LPRRGGSREKSYAPQNQSKGKRRIEEKGKRKSEKKGKKQKGFQAKKKGKREEKGFQAKNLKCRFQANMLPRKQVLVELQRKMIESVA